MKLYENYMNSISEHEIKTETDNSTTKTDDTKHKEVLKLLGDSEFEEFPDGIYVDIKTIDPEKIAAKLDNLKVSYDFLDSKESVSEDLDSAKIMKILIAKSSEVSESDAGDIAAVPNVIKFKDLEFDEDFDDIDLSDSALAAAVDSLCGDEDIFKDRDFVIDVIDDQSPEIKQSIMTFITDFNKDYEIFELPETFDYKDFISELEDDEFEDFRIDLFNLLFDLKDLYSLDNEITESVPDISHIRKLRRIRNSSQGKRDAKIRARDRMSASGRQRKRKAAIYAKKYAQKNKSKISKYQRMYAKRKLREAVELVEFAFTKSGKINNINKKIEVIQKDIDKVKDEAKAEKRKIRDAFDKKIDAVQKRAEDKKVAQKKEEQRKNKETKSKKTEVKPTNEADNIQKQISDLEDDKKDEIEKVDIRLQRKIEDLEANIDKLKDQKREIRDSSKKDDYRRSGSGVLGKMLGTVKRGIDSLRNSGR
nr:MAG TPA: hypothetical protein [Caudoviricetes sp.]